MSPKLARAPKQHHSTGPRTAAGKSVSSQNSLRHGLASGALLIPGEDPQAFKALLNNLLAEWDPATPTERLLVENMAKHHWLVERSLRLQSQALATITEPGTLPDSFAVLLRYQTTNERAFSRALKSLQELRKLNAEFVSQKQHAGQNANEAEALALLAQPFPMLDIPAELERIRAGRPPVPPATRPSSSCGPK